VFSMYLNQYQRSPVRVRAHLKELSDGSVICDKDCKIYIPTAFRDKHLASLGNDIYIVGIYMLSVEDKYYAVSMVPSMMRIDPSSINQVVIDGVDHFEFIFEAGDTVFASTDLVKNAKLLYYVFDYIVARGKVPPYLNYLDLGKLFDYAPKFTGTKLASTPTILHMLLSMICRDPKDLSKYFRQVTNGKDLESVTYVPMRSATHGATNTTARLMGAHFTDNLTSALVNPSEREENIEHILRM